MPELPKIKPARDKLEAINGKRTDYHDAGKDRVRGLALRISTTGQKSWVVSARRPGHKNPTRITIGEYRSLGLKDARTRASKIKDGLRDGVDVVAERRSRHNNALLNVENTFGAWVQEYLDGYSAANHRVSTQGEVRRILEHEFSCWNKWPIADVTAGVIGTKLRAINSRNKWAKGYSGNTAYRYLRAFFNWTTPQCETLSASPMVELARPKKKEQKGARTPSVDDMLTLWRTMPDTGSLPGLTRVLMVTGARLGEVAGMEWSEILDGEELVWRLPAGRTKEDRAKDIPLSSTAAAIILAQPKIKGCALVFPTSTGRPYKKGAIDKPWKRWFASTAMADVEYFHRHDIRRGVITGLNDYLNAWLAHNKAGVYVRSEVVEEIVGHAGGGHKSGIKAHYNNATYDDERRMALDAWADFLWGKLIADAPDNIVSIKPS